MSRATSRSASTASRPEGATTMASWQARVARHLVRKRVRPALGDMRDLMRVRKVMSTAMPPLKGVTYTRDALGGVPGEWIEREDAADIAPRPRPTLMYVHGGGFVGCSPRTHRAITSAFALQGYRVFAPDYRLPPPPPLRR